MEPHGEEGDVPAIGSATEEDLEGRALSLTKKVGESRERESYGSAGNISERGVL